MSPLRIAIAALSLLGMACSQLGHDFPVSKGAGASLARAPVPAAAVSEPPLGPGELKTTDGELALANLDAEISGLTRAIAKNASIERTASLAEDLETRGQYQGRPSDYEEAARLADAAVLRFGNDGRAYALRGKARAVHHRFAEALADLDRAQVLGVSERALKGTRASILQALGRYAEALAIRHASRVEKPELSSLGNEASVLADMGELAKAEQLFASAQHSYHDVSPFPVAWLWFQQGSMWEKRGKLERARALFEAAIARVPRYAHATSHLASLASPSRAIGLMQAIHASSDDPEYAAQLGVLLTENGQSAAGAPLIASARAAYDELTLRHPEAFADHAARFWLGAGADAHKALTWAGKSAAARPTGDSLTLLIDAALAAHDDNAACAAAKQALALERVPSALHALSAVAFDHCGLRQAADHERQVASLAP